MKTILRRGAGLFVFGALLLSKSLVVASALKSAPALTPKPPAPGASPAAPPAAPPVAPLGPTPIHFTTGVFPKPFWEGKPKIEAKLRDDRAVLVSVRTERGTIDKEADLFSINGVGWVKRSTPVVFELAKRFDRLKEISSYFREVKFDPKTNRVFVICEALGYQARMLVAVEPQNGLRAGSAGDANPSLRFKVIDGHFVGLEGVMAFRPLERGASLVGLTEVSLRVRHEAREIPIPRILVGFALEVLVQKVAQSMRTYFETAQP